MNSARDKLALDDTLLAQIHQAVDGGLAELTLKDLLAHLLDTVALSERSLHLKQQPDDAGNGSYGRGLSVGSLPLEVHIPRTRSGQFRPGILPPRYQRGYAEESQALLLGLLASSRSLNAAKASLKKLGLSVPEADLDVVAKELVEEIDLRNTRPIPPDLLALFVDGKYVDIREEDRLRPACIYTVVGMTREGKKRILSCEVHTERENLETWKKVLNKLFERGLRRVLIVVHDDFSGLLPVTQGMFPKSDIQLCIVHMQRNAKTHLSKTSAASFQQQLKTIKAAWDVGAGKTQFADLCKAFEAESPVFIKHLRKRSDNYLAFLSYPEPIRRGFSTTNVVEAVNGQLERMRRNNGGYFQSEQTLKLKLGIAVTHLEDGTWRNAPGTIVAVLPQLNAMFVTRFESDA